MREMGNAMAGDFRMRELRATALAALLAAGATGALAQEPFDACTVFTDVEAKIALGGNA